MIYLNIFVFIWLLAGSHHIAYFWGKEPPTESQKKDYRLIGIVIAGLIMWPLFHFDEKDNK